MRGIGANELIHPQPYLVHELGQYRRRPNAWHVRGTGIGDILRRRLAGPGAGDDRGGIADDVGANTVCGRPVVVKALVEQVELERVLLPIERGVIVSILHRGRQQAEHDRRKGGKQPDGQLHELHGLGRLVLFRQPALDQDTQPGAPAQQRKDGDGPHHLEQDSAPRRRPRLTLVDRPSMPTKSTKVKLSAAPPRPGVLWSAALREHSMHGVHRSG